MPINPLIGSALISAGTNIAGGLLGSFGQSSANQTNIQLQQMQNVWNERMWRLNNEYNDPSAQMQRLINAGVSPTLAAQTVQGGNSNAPANSVQPAQVHNTLQPMQDSLTNASISMAQMYGAISQGNLNEVTARNNTLLAEADVILKGKQAGLLTSKKEYQDILNKFQGERSSLENQKLRKELSKLSAEVNETWSRYHLNKSSARLQDAKRKQVELNTKLIPELTSAQIFSLRTQAIASFKQAVIAENLSPYQKRQLIASASLITNQALIAKHEGDIKKLEAKISKQLGIPLSTAQYLVGETLNSIGSLAGTYLNKKLPSLIKTLE